ncbi:MAG TPA: hypothetical protein VFN78_14315 [Ktedonobacterales bacterium]|nr:hypothetical protein [Ktedonobacterales bacterium]
MSWYTVALFAHIVGVLALFITQAMQWLITLRLRRASSVAQVREWSGLSTSINRLAPVSGVLILGAGGYMTAAAWSVSTTWVDVSLGAMVIMMVLGMGVVSRRLKAIQRAAALLSLDAMPTALRTRIDDPALWVSVQTTFAVALGIVFMMSNKTDLAASVAVVIVSLALGAVIGTATLRPRRVTQPLSAVVGAKDAGVR